MPARYLLTAVVIALIVAGGVAAVDAGVQETGPEKVVNETFQSPSAGATVTLNQSNLDSVRYFRTTQITVTDENGTLMVPGEDFDWDQANGTLDVLAGGRLAGDSEGTIEYGFRLTSAGQEEAGSFAGNGFEVAGVLVFVTAVGFVLISLRAFEVI